MNRIRRSRLLCLVLFIAIAFALSACQTCEQCENVCVAGCIPTVFVHPIFAAICITDCTAWLCAHLCGDTNSQRTYTEDPDTYTTAFGQLQIAVIQICEEYPTECQEAFDSYFESLGKEETE